MEPWSKMLKEIEARGLKRRLRPVQSAALPDVERGGRPLINLASNNYLGLAADPRLVAAAQAALAHWGVGAGASRLVSGSCEIHEALEADLAAFKGAEAALVFTSGYAANVGVLTALAGPGDHIFADRLNHASLIDGCRMTRAQLHLYPHRDLEQLEQRLRETPTQGGRFIITDSIFSMEGDLAPLPELAQLAEHWGAILIVDDAHGTGMLGPQGRGALEHFGVGGRIHVQIGTLSKALGAQGGFVTGSRALIDLLINRARSFIFSTGLAPVLAAAAREALVIVQTEAWRRKVHHQYCHCLRQALARLGYSVLGEEAAPMLAIQVGEPEPALALAAQLEALGVLAPAIRPPSVPPGTSRLRLAPMTTHTQAHLERVLAAFAMVGEAAVR